MPGEAFTKVTCAGTIGTSTAPYEIFSYGFAIKHDGDIVADSVGNAIAAAIGAFHESTDLPISNRAVLRKITLAHKDATGKQDQPSVQYAVTKYGASTGEAGHPPQVSLAVSLRGPNAVKPVRGRFYLPLPMSTVDMGTGLISAADALAVANRTVVLINSIKAAGPGILVGIDSKTGVVPVTEVRCGRVLDTIRSRRNANKEAYVPAVTALS